MFGRIRFVAICLSPLLLLSISCGSNHSASSESQVQESTNVDPQPSIASTPSTDGMVNEACGIRNPGDCVPRRIPSAAELVNKVTEEAKNLAAKLGLDNWQTGIIDAIAKPTALVIKDDAERGGWTKATCVGVGGGLIGSLVYQAPICGAIGAGIGSVACVGFISANSALVAEATCTQLCHNHHLQDCK